MSNMASKVGIAGFDLATGADGIRGGEGLTRIGAA